MEEKKKIEQIDVAKIAKKLWAHRKTYYKVLPATLIITYLITVCVPRYYKCDVSLAPELSSGASMSGSLGSLASSFGLGSLSKIGNDDALHAEIYPNILKSNDFVAELMTIEVTTKKGDIKTNYYTYLRDKQSAAWWDVIKGTISEWIKPTPKDAYNGTEKIDVFNLTKLQSDIFDAAIGKIKCSVDKKTDVVSISVEDQDPLVCATMANATCKKLQEFIVKYRTNKARIDYEHYKTLCQQTHDEYAKIRQQYTAYADANKDVMLARYKAKEEDLENEMQLKYNIYTAMNTQMQAAAAKLQEATPAFTVIQSATVPNKPAGPKRMIIAVIVMLLTFAGMSFYFLHRQ
jgi:hypothetical protein